MEIVLKADEEDYPLAHVQDPDIYHLIVISYKNGEIWSRIDNAYYKNFELKDQFTLKNELILYGKNTKGQFWNV